MDTYALYVWLFFVAGSPKPEMIIHPTIHTMTFCTELQALDRKQGTLKYLVGMRKDGTEVIRATTQCVPLDPREVAALKKSVEGFSPDMR
jgi:hypothetical protein